MNKSEKAARAAAAKLRRRFKKQAPYCYFEMVTISIKHKTVWAKMNPSLIDQVKKQVIGQIVKFNCENLGFQFVELKSQSIVPYGQSQEETLSPKPLSL